MWLFAIYYTYSYNIYTLSIKTIYMPILSKFHDTYQNNKEEIDEDARILQKYAFMNKYHIWNVTYDVYFRWKSNFQHIRLTDNSRRRTEDMRERHSKIMKKARDRQDHCVDWFNKKVKEVSNLFGIPFEDVINLTKDYTVSEIEHWHMVDGKLVVCDEVKMEDPGDITNSMSGRWRSIV